MRGRRGSSWASWLIRLMWAGWLGGLLVFGILLALAIQGAAGKLPTLEEIENPRYTLATRIFSADGEEIGRFAIQQRVFVPYERISPWVIRALIATEDARFFEHAGIDWKGTLAAVVYTLVGKRRGGSTITQQLAKNLFPRTRTSNIFWLIVTKLKEWVVAVEIERHYTKREILALYLNVAPFGGMIYGIQAASEYYFRKPPDSLLPEEAALLIGMLKGTSIYNPFLHPERARKRRNIVLLRMYRVGYLTQETYDSLRRLPLHVERGKIARNPFHARKENAYFLAYLRKHLRQILKQVEARSGISYDLYRDGLQIYTTLHTRMQEYAYRAMREHLSFLQQKFFERVRPFDHRKRYESILIREMKKTFRYRYARDSLGLPEEEIFRRFQEPDTLRIFTWEGARDSFLSPMDSILHHLSILQTGILGVDAPTGAIRIWIGGPDFTFFQYDHVLARRQVGSTIKPLVYALPITRGWSPCDLLPNEPVIFEDYNNWSPGNAGFPSGGMVYLVQGLAYSLNVITARIVKYFTPEVVASFVRQFGFDAEIPPYPSIVLGTPEIPLYEMVRAFTVFHNKGILVEPYAIEQIMDRSGKVIYSHVPEMKSVLAPEHAEIMLWMMNQVVNHGTGIALRFRFHLSGEIAGKTGTTEEHADGWFIGMVPGLIIGVWVGWEYPEFHFHTLEWGQGARMALPIFGKTLQQIWNDPELPYKPGQFYTLSDKIRSRFACILQWEHVKRTMERTMAGNLSETGSSPPDSDNDIIF